MKKEVVYYGVEGLDDREPMQLFSSAELAYGTIEKKVQYLRNFYGEDEVITLDTELYEVVGNIYPVDMAKIGIHILFNGVVIGKRFTIHALTRMEEV